HIYLIRHGDYDEVENGKSLDNPGLAPRGVRQVELLRDRLARTGEIKADALIASPAHRAQETARILAGILGAPMLLDRDLEEWRCDNGALSPEEFAARWQQVSHEQQPFFRWVEGGESWVEFTARVQLALNRIWQEYAGKTIVIVSHGGVIQASFSYFFNLSATTIPGIAIENTAITHWSKLDAAQRWTLHEHNDHHHLQSPV
ncbi:MAG TPA: histidine phosphatase family protein, partial [Ktedonobacterales bacterium]|nr:histidine phosphatase family protein [Ktedonobacterales bacterium]